jgi:hypothetical protein
VYLVAIIEYLALKVYIHWFFYILQLSYAIFVSLKLKC